MNASLPVTAISDTRYLFEHFQFDPNDELLIFHQHGPLLHQAMFQCLDLRDLVNPQLNSWLNMMHLEHVVGRNISQINDDLHWCEWAQIAWFSKAFQVIYERSWQKQMAVLFSTYIFPVIAFLNLLSLGLTLFGVSRLLGPYKIRDKKHLIHHDYDLIHVPATWPILVTYCWIAIACVLIIDLRGLIFAHLPAYCNPLNFDLGCRVITYLRNVFRYTPTWLLAVMLADRVLGEFRHSERVVNHTQPAVVTVDDIDRNNTHLSINEEPCRSNKIVPISSALTVNDHGVKCKRSKRSSQTGCKCGLLNDILCVYRGPICCMSLSAIPTADTVSHSKHLDILRTGSGTASFHRPRPSTCARSDWLEVGAGRIGGYLLVGTTVSGLCLINTHTIWLYEINRDWKKCMLTAGNSVILEEFYPYFTQVRQF
ncbi:unnamed protein product [Echinostoma caproni]|uniref:Anoctamin n=1 Tax=Echinostoma caproni TaxID=27848 RepID=A0A183AIM9_9TREM|nr:unnamed protein product [Echinostoma caproni]